MIEKIQNLAIKKLNEEKRLLTDSNILAKMMELSDGEITDIVMRYNGRIR